MCPRISGATTGFGGLHQITKLITKYPLPTHQFLSHMCRFRSKPFMDISVVLTCYQAESSICPSHIRATGHCARSDILRCCAIDCLANCWFCKYERRQIGLRHSHLERSLAAFRSVSEDVIAGMITAPCVAQNGWKQQQLDHKWGPWSVRNPFHNLVLLESSWNPLVGTQFWANGFHEWVLHSDPFGMIQKPLSDQFPGGTQYVNPMLFAPVIRGLSVTTFSDTMGKTWKIAS